MQGIAKFAIAGSLIGCGLVGVGWDGALVGLGGLFTSEDAA